MTTGFLERVIIRKVQIGILWVQIDDGGGSGSLKGSEELSFLETL